MFEQQKTKQNTQNLRPASVRDKYVAAVENSRISFIFLFFQFKTNMLQYVELLTSNLRCSRNQQWSLDCAGQILNFQIT